MLILELVWKRFTHAINENKKYDDFYPESYVLARLPNSGTVVAYKTTTDTRECDHEAEKELIRAIEEDLRLETDNNAFTINLYYPTYSLCADCVELMANLIDDMSSESVDLTIKVHVLAIVGPVHRYELQQARQLWLCQPGLQLKTCLTPQTCQDYFNSVFILLTSHIEVFKPLWLRNKIAETSERRERRGRSYSEKDIFLQRIKQKWAEKILYATEECENAATKMEFILDGTPKCKFVYTKGI